VAPPVDPVADRPEMPGYGVFAADEGPGLLSWSWAEERLSRARRYWVASARPDGRPHLMPVWAVWFDGTLCFSTGGRSRKAQNLFASSTCSMSTDDAAEAVIVEGAVRRAAADEVDAIVEVYVAKYDEAPPDPADNPLFVLTPAKVLGFYEAEDRFATSATRWTFPGH
jgi:hypothetical protein